MAIPFSTRTLAGACLGVGIACGCTSLWLLKRVQINIANGAPYQLALKELYSCQPVCDLLGKPIKAKYISLSDRGTRIGAKSAVLNIPLSGSKRSGTLHVKAEKGVESWEVVKLSLELATPVPDAGWSEVVIKAELKTQTLVD